MVTGLNHGSSVDEMNDVGVARCGEAVGDHQGGPVGDVVEEPAQPLGLGPRIHGRRRFVEQHNVGVAKERPRECQPLPFPKAEFSPAEPWPKHRIDALRASTDDVVSTSSAEGGTDSVRIGIVQQVAVRHVLAHSCAETQGHLEQDRYSSSQLSQRQVSQIDTIDLDSAALGIVESKEQLEQGALPRTVAPQQGDGGTRRGHQG
jgi:hypothetical protein